MDKSLDDNTPDILFPVPGYERLAQVLKSAYEQAALGKGADRHAQGLPFDQQPIQQISELLSTSDGLRYQAIKKIQESSRLPTRHRQIAELLGAIVYIAGVVVYIENHMEDYG
jgi:hypothetical protein